MDIEDSGRVAAEKESRRAARRQKAVAVKQRRAQALELYFAGVSVRRIAKLTGVSHTQAASDIRTELDALERTDLDQLSRRRVVQLQRIDRIVGALWPSRSDAATARAIVAALEREARLCGLDKPLKIASTT